jgi:hypothetical protein
MHLYRLTIFILMMGVFFSGDLICAQDNNSRLTNSSISLDTLLPLLRELVSEVRSEPVPREIIKRPISSGGCVHVKDVLKRSRLVIFHTNEGVVYNPKVAGKYYPLFPYDRFRINEHADFKNEDFLIDSWDELIAYVGLYIFDNTDQRRHALDSLDLKTDASRQVIKK